MHRGNQEAKLLRQMAPQCPHPRQHLAALFLVDQGDELESDFEAQIVQPQDRRQILRLASRLSFARRLGAAAAGAPRFDPASPHAPARPHGSRNASLGNPGIRHSAAITPLAI